MRKYECPSVIACRTDAPLFFTKHDQISIQSTLIDSLRHKLAWSLAPAALPLSGSKLACPIPVIVS